jgi:hypothetical protein
MYGFQVYHLNLAFSSIPAAARGTVVRSCYWPLLEMARLRAIPVGVELSGWTLSQIQQLDPEWVERFREMLLKGECELVGSGWTQMIGPLVPVEVTRWNQRLGREAYERLLGIAPKLALVNEMAFSTGMVGLYREAGYEGIIMDRDNVRLALNLDHESPASAPTHALGTAGEALPVLWSDSILFQRLQRVVHGDIPVCDYLGYVRQRSLDAAGVLPVYCNDAEVFDFRPGRFSTEARLHPEGEWARMCRIFGLLEEGGMQWVSPSSALELQNVGRAPEAACLSSAAHPIPVKKQAKYNINRWALTGRDDLWLNTACHRLHRRLVAQGEHSPDAWRAVCEFWASDLRTHITGDRWAEMLEALAKFEAKFLVDSEKVARNPPPVRCEPRRARVERTGEGIYWRCETEAGCVVLNVRRGLTFQSVAFRRHGFKPFLGTLSQGYFPSIELGADYYSGGVLIEIPGERRRFTDLEWVEPELGETEEEIWIEGVVPMPEGRLRKTITFGLHEERLRVTYAFEDWKRPIGMVRVGNFTFLPSALELPLALECKNGGQHRERFIFERSFNHSASASHFVSSSSGIGATDGVVRVVDRLGRGLEVDWDPSQCAAVPMVKHLKTPESHLTRLCFSMCELDDTSKEGGRLLPLTLSLRPV